MSKNINYYINTLVNLRKNHLFTPSNILRVLGIVSQNKAFTGPLKITMDITNKCDMECVMCWYHSPTLREKLNMPKELSLEKIRSLAKEFRRLGVKDIMLTGEGEPLMHSRILEIIEAIRDNALEVEIMTNAYYLDREKVRYLIDMGVKKIIVSLHCADARTFQKIRPLKDKNDFERIIENLLFLKKIKGNRKFPLLYITNVLLSFNYATAHKMVELAKRINADKVLFKPLTLTPHLDRGLMLTGEDKQKCISDLKILSAKIDIPNNLLDYIKTLAHKKEVFGKGSRNLLPNARPQRLMLCYMPWVHSVIGLNGEVIGCVYSNRQPIGNIYQSSFTDIWYGRKYRLFRKEIFCPRKCLGRAVYPLLV